MCRANMPRESEIRLIFFQKIAVNFRATGGTRTRDTAAVDPPLLPLRHRAVD